ncbi:MAG: recombinase RecT [Pseudonocardiales bacterium]|nr:recombinase RecT [Pseudonocardiales bacterium]
MSATTVKQAKQENGTALDVIQSHKRDLALVLPSHVKPTTWLSVAMGAVRKNEELWLACNQTPSSMMVALMEAARLGLEPGTEEYYLTPRRNKAGRWEVLGITGYVGEIELIYRAGAAASVVCEVVCHGDTFIWRPGRYDDRTPPRWHGPMTQPLHEVPDDDWFGERDGSDNVKGAYCYCIMKDGAISKVAVVGQSRIRRAMQASGTANASHSPWKSDYAAMVLKTAVHVERKFVPSSAEYRLLRARAERITAGGEASPIPLTLPAAPWIDGEVVANPPASPPAAPAPARSSQPPSEPAQSSTPDEPPAPAHPDPAANAAAQKPNRAQMTRLTKLLAEAGVTSDDGRRQLIERVMGREDLRLDQLTANDASQLITKLDALKAAGRLGPQSDDTTTEGEQA